MLSTERKIYISNPALGAIPILVYVILHSTDIIPRRAFLIALCVSVITELFVRRFFKTRAFSLAFYIVDACMAIGLISTFLLRDLGYNKNTFYVISEVSYVCFYAILHLSKTFIRIKYLNKRTRIQRELLDEFFFSSQLIRNIFTFHLFILLVYTYLKRPNLSYEIGDFIVFTLIPAIIFVTLFVYEAIKMSSLSVRLQREEWLPIITADGSVTSKIAKSVTFKLKNKHLHPVVRIVLVCNGDVYLQERPVNDILSSGKLDTPFEKYVLFNHDLNLAVRNCISRMLGYYHDFPLTFLLKYDFQNEDTKRLNVVYVAHVSDETEIRRTGNMVGKFWTQKQIEDGFVDDIFSEAFVLEYEYLKNKVLSPQIEERIDKSVPLDDTF